MEPIRLKVKNFYALTDGEINFTLFSSALILGYYENNLLMSNGAGKSAIFEAICWNIFNETRQTKVDDVIRWSASEALVEFDFTFGRDSYKIIRRRSRIAKESSVSLFTKQNDKWINDSGSTNSETNKKILALLKIDAKIFLNSVYFKQHDISLFANSSPSDRKEIIKSIMKLERWDEYQKQAKNKLKNIKDDVEKQIRLLQENSNLPILNIENIKSIEAIENELNVLNQEHVSAQKKLHALFELKKERDINNLIKSLDNINKKIFDLKISGKKLQNKQIDLSGILDSLLSKGNSCSQQIINLDGYITQLDNKISSLKKENCAHGELSDLIITQRVKKNMIENGLVELQEASSRIGIGECHFCFSSITESNLNHIHETNQARITSFKNDLIKISAELYRTEQEYLKRKKNQENIDILNYEIESQKSALAKLQHQKHFSDDEVSLYEKEIKIIDTSMRSVIDQIKSFKIEVESIEAKIAEQKIHNIDIEISNIENENRSILHKINTRSIELGTLLKEKEILLKKQKNIEHANDKLTKLTKEKVSYDQLVRYFGKDGIQAVFIESIVDELEQYANTTLSYICNEPTVIRLKTQKKTGDSWQETLEIDVIMNGFSQTFESLGGGERFRISLALRIGLSEVLVKRVGGEIKLLLLDEVDSPLDTYGLNNLFENIIRGLEKRFKILVISHNDKLKDRFNDIITVKKTNGGSFISQT